MSSTWRRPRKLPEKASSDLQSRGAERTNELEKANQDLQAAQAELQKRWQHLAEAQKLSHSGTFGWKVQTGELIWSEETYRILGFAPETNLTLDLIFDRIHPDDRDRLQQLKDRATQTGMDLDVDHRILMPDGIIKYVHVVAHAGKDNLGNLEYIGVVSDITERKRTNEELQTLSRDLQQSNARLEEAQRIAHVGHWEWNLETGHLTWSDETYRIYGLRPQERPIDIAALREMIHPEDREAMFRKAVEALLSGVRPEAEFRIVHPNGEVRIVHSQADAKRDASGRPYQMFGTVQDITERKRGEEALQRMSRDLQESKAWLEEAQRVAHVGYWVWDLATNHLIWSDESYRIFGLTPQEGLIDLDKVREMIHSDDREAVFRTAEEAVRSGTRADCEHRLFRPDGEMRIVHSLGDLKKDSSGRPYQMFGTTQDITDRKRSEEERQTLSNALQQSNARLEEAQRVAHIGHYELNPIENQVTWSAELCRIWGLAPVNGPIDMAVVFEMVHPKDRECAARAVEEILRSGTHLKHEHRIVRPDGEVRFVQVLGTVKRDGSGRAYELFGTCQDITDRKLAEQALRRNQFYLSEGERLAHMGSWASKDLGIRWSDDLGLYWSDEVYKIYGLDPKNGTPNLQQYLALIHPQDRVSMAETIKTMHEQRCGCDVTKRIVRPDGETRYVRSVGIPVVEDGVFQGFHGTTMDVTDQELLTQELRREQAYLTDAQGMAHIGSWSYNLITQMPRHSSDENARLYGFDPSQGPISAERFFATLHAEDAPYVNATVERAVREGTDFYLDGYRIHHTDGSIRFLRAIGRPNASGEPGEYVGVTMDITERKRAEEALQRSQFYLSEGQRLAHIGSWAAKDLGVRWSDDLGIYWSDEVYKIFGLDPQNGPPNLEQYLAAVHPDDRASMAETVRVMHEQRSGCDVTHRIVRPDGEVRHVRCVGVPVFEDGVFKAFHGSTIDVTEHEILTQELRREQAYLAEAQSLAHIGSWASNLATSQNFHLSDETYRIHGFDPRQGPPGLERFWDTTHPEDEPWVRAAIEDAVRKGMDYDIRDFRICRADDGQIRFLRTIGHRNPAGEIGDYVGITMDITELKRAEEERERLRRLEAELAHINRVNMLGELAAALAHEIKQPIAASITSANTCLRWLAHDPPNLERARAAAARSEREGNRAADVINRLRSFYKKGAPPKREIVDVEAIILEMAALFKIEANRHSVTIHSAVDVNTPKIAVDRVQLQQVFMNLMLNAIEAMKDAGGELTITARPSPEGQLVVSISDTGVGLPAENAERIFDAFHTTKPEGTGMGLAITRSILESHGGRVWASSNPGTGATFHFTLPIEAEAHA